MQKIKIKFVDFWPGFIPNQSYFYDILGGDDIVELSEKPDILFFSNFGNEHKNYNCFKVFFSSENERPNMFKCDIALTSDYNKNKRHFRLPLFVLYLHHYKKDYSKLYSSISIDELQNWKKRKFCCFVVSNGNSKERIKFFNFLNKKEPVDSGGRFLNNIGAPVEDKLEFIKNYKFVISFENSSYPGYITEKILEPFLTQSIPIYWGDPKAHDDFSSSSFVNVIDYANFQAVYNRMKEIENSDQLINEYLNSIKLNLNKSYLDSDKLGKVIITIFEKSNKPISKKIIYKTIGKLLDQLKKLIYWAKHYTTGNFR